MMEKLDIDKSIQENFKKLSRGLMQPSYPVAFEAHKDLYEIGKPVIPLLKEKILEVDWSNSNYKKLSGYISGLYSLLHDLAEEEAYSVCNNVISNRCPKLIKNRRDVHQKINKDLNKVRLHQFNNLKVHNLNAKIS